MRTVRVHLTHSGSRRYCLLENPWRGWATSNLRRRSAVRSSMRKQTLVSSKNRSPKSGYGDTCGRPILRMALCIGPRCVQMASVGVDSADDRLVGGGAWATSGTRARTRHSDERYRRGRCAEAQEVPIATEELASCPDRLVCIARWEHPLVTRATTAAHRLACLSPYGRARRPLCRRRLANAPSVVRSVIPYRDTVLLALSFEVTAHALCPTCSGGNSQVPVTGLFQVSPNGGPSVLVIAGESFICSTLDNGGRGPSSAVRYNNALCRPGRRKRATQSLDSLSALSAVLDFDCSEKIHTRGRDTEGTHPS